MQIHDSSENGEDDFGDFAEATTTTMTPPPCVATATTTTPAATTGAAAAAAAGAVSSTSNATTQHAIRLVLPDFAALVPPCSTAAAADAAATATVSDAVTAAVASTPGVSNVTAAAAAASVRDDEAPAWRHARLLARDGTLDKRCAVYLDDCCETETALAQQLDAALIAKKKTTATAATTSNTTVPDTLIALLRCAARDIVAAPDATSSTDNVRCDAEATSATAAGEAHDAGDADGSVAYALRALGFDALHADDWACNGHYVATTRDNNNGNTHTRAQRATTASPTRAGDANAHLAALATAALTLPCTIDAAPTLQQHGRDDDTLHGTLLPIPLEAVAAMQLERQLGGDATLQHESLQDVLKM